MTAASRGSRLLLRVPILLHRVRLGWVLGRRFVYVAHRGHRSGKRRETVLEVVRYGPDTPEIFIASGWGTRSGWYLNLRSHPALEVRIDTRRFPAPRPRFLNPEETVKLFARLSMRPPPRVATARAHPRPTAKPGTAIRDIPAISFIPAQAHIAEGP